jgi:hypothetical protein
MNDAIQAAVNSGKISDFIASRIVKGDFTLQFALAKDSGRLISVVIAFAVFECFFVALFYYSRLKFRSKHDFDLWLMMPTFLVCFANLVICISKWVSRYTCSWWWKIAAVYRLMPSKSWT